MLGDAAVSLERLHGAVSGLVGQSESRQAECEDFRERRYAPRGPHGAAGVVHAGHPRRAA